MDRSLLFFYLFGVFLVLNISLIVYYVFYHSKIKLTSLPMYFLILSSIYILFAQYLKYLSLHFYVDFSHWATILYNITTSGKSLNLSQEFLYPGTLNYLSAHFVPMIYVLAIPFKLWTYNETIIVFNFILMISAAVPLYKIALIHYRDKRFALFMVTLLLWYPTFQYTILYEFEMLRFSIPIILWMLYFWEKKKMILYFIFVVLAILVREEVGLTIMMFGLYLIFFEKKHLRGLVTTIMGLGAFILITQIVIPSLRTTNNYRHIALGTFASLGSGFSEIITNIIIHPALVFREICQPFKLANIFMFFLPLLFIPLLSPTVLFSSLGNFGVGMLSGSITHCSYMLYYISPSIPFIFLAFIKGWPRFLTVLKNLMSKWSKDTATDFGSAAMAMILSGLLVTNVFFGPSPISLQFWFKNIRPAPFKTQNFHYSVYRISEHHRKVEEFCRLIPESAIVSAQQFLAPQLFKKRGVMVFPKLESLDGTTKADYVFFDKTNNGLNKNSPAYITQVEFNLIEENKQTWKLIKSEDGYFLYKRIRE